MSGKLTKADGVALDDKDFTAGVNNLPHSLFSQCSVAVNNVSFTQSRELHRAYLETLLTYDSDAAATHLTNAFSYLDTGDFYHVILQLLTRKTVDS